MNIMQINSLPCKELQVVQCLKHGFLAGPKETAFRIVHNSKQYEISVVQMAIREIDIKSDCTTSSTELWEIFTFIDELIMLFEGCFVPILKIDFVGGNTPKLELIGEELKDRRLSKYLSADFSLGNDLLLADYNEQLSAVFFDKWKGLRKELDIVHDMALYSLADTGITIDLKCAFLIEALEPLCELAEKFDCKYQRVNNNSCLRNCIESIIQRYGLDIFDVEVTKNKEKLLSVMVWSRKRMMHIKRNVEENRHFSGTESVLYAKKLSLLYRHILLSLLGVDYQEYHSKLENNVLSINKDFKEILDDFILKKLS